MDLLYGSSDLPKETINEILMLEEIRSENDRENSVD
jgi:hypothetical protein